MDWYKHTQDMLKSWTDTQQKMWDSWLQGLQGADKSANGDAWLKMIEIWQRSATDMFAAQTELAQIWLESLKNVEPNSGNAADWAKQVEEMFKQTCELQHQLWDSYFAALKSADPSKLPGPWEQETKQLFQSWQEAARNAMDTQARLFATWNKR